MITSLVFFNIASTKWDGARKEWLPEGRHRRVQVDACDWLPVLENRHQLHELQQSTLHHNITVKHLTNTRAHAWKAHARPPIHHNWTFFASSYCWDVPGGNLSTWAISVGSGSLQSPILGGRGCRPPTTVGWQKTRRIALSCNIKILPMGSLD